METETIIAEQLNQLIQARRTVYPDQFVPGKKVPDEIIQQLLENANWAPTHKNTEPWRFVVFTDEGLKKLAFFQAACYQKNAGEKFRQEKYEKLLRTPPLCSHVIAIGMKRNELVPEMEEMAAVACAVENIWLTTVAYGLGGYWSTGGTTYDKEAWPFFGLDDNDRLMGFFYLGYIAIPSARSSRKPVRDKTVWVKE